MKNKKTDIQDFNRNDYWEHIFSAMKSTDASCYQHHSQHSLEMIKAANVDVSAHIIDIGGSASTLVDYLLDTGYQKLTVLDIARGSIEQAKSRLGVRADKVTWLEHDITKFASDQQYELWHDRAVFHFLTDKIDRSSYVHAMSRVLKPGSQAIIATFDLDGPEKFNDLNVVRYSPDKMSAVLGDGFRLVGTSTEAHVTPGASEQSYVYCRFKRVVR